MSDTRRSDHSPFWDRGYPALLITDTANYRNRNYHLPGDTSDKLDFAFAAQVTRAVLATAIEMAAIVPPTSTPPPTILRTPQPTPTALPDGARVELYTTNSKEVVIFEVDRGLVAGRIPIAAAHDVVLSPDQGTAYISAGFDTSAMNPPRIYVYDVKERAIADSVEFVATTPYGLTLSGDGQLLYVSLGGVVGGLTIMSRASLDVVGEFDIRGGTSLPAAVTPDGKAAVLVGSEILAVDLSDLVVDDRINLVGDVRGMKMTPDGRTVYTTQQEANRMSVIDVESRSVVAEIPVAGPVEIVIDRCCASCAPKA